MGELHDRLRDEPDPAAREQIKLDYYNERADSWVGRTVVRRNFTMTLDDIVVGMTPAGSVMLSCVVSVVNTNTGNVVTPPDLNPIIVVNPGFIVDDPDGEIDLDGGRHARESLVDAFLGTLTDVLRSRVG